MKKNFYGIIIIIINIINIFFMLFCYLVYDMGLNNNIYIIGGTIISIGLLIFLFKNSIYGYLGTLGFYGIQMFGTDLIFENFRYGFIIRSESDVSLNSNDFQFDLNTTAILLVILSLLGYLRHEKLAKESITELNK